MAKPELEIKDLEDKIAPINENNRLYVQGDHWQEGDGYSGALMQSTDERYGLWLADKERTFVSMDILSEVRKRERWALTGKAWTWHIQDENGEPIDEATEKELDGYLTNWFEKKQVVSTVADCIEHSSWSGDRGFPGRGMLRFYIPEVRLNNGRAEAENLGQALELIELESPDSGTATVIEDADTEYEPVGFISWKEEKGGEEIERAELVYVNEQGMTVLEILAGESTGTSEINLRKKLTMYELKRPLLITESLRSQQKSLNHALTAFQSTVSAAGWPEDFFIGVFPPGKWVQAADGTETYVADPIDRGPGRTHFFQPVTGKDADGTEKAIQSGSHSKSQQASPHLFTEAKKDARENILASVFQEYTSLTGLAQASGEKLQLAKGDFEASVTDMANETRLMIRWVIETALALAESITGVTEPTEYNVFVDVRIDTGVVTTEHKIQYSQLVNEKFISRLTALSEAGYNQPEAEIKVLEQEAEKLAAAGVTEGTGSAEAPGGAKVTPGVPKVTKPEAEPGAVTPG